MIADPNQVRVPKMCVCLLKPPTFNGHFRNLNWRYLPYICGLCFRAIIPPKYGQTYGTNVAPCIGSWNSHWNMGAIPQSKKMITATSLNGHCPSHWKWDLTKTSLHKWHSPWPWLIQLRLVTSYFDDYGWLFLWDYNSINGVTYLKKVVFWGHNCIKYPNGWALFWIDPPGLGQSMISRHNPHLSILNAFQSQNWMMGKLTPEPPKKNWMVFKPWFFRFSDFPNGTNPLIQVGIFTGYAPSMSRAHRPGAGEPDGRWLILSWFTMWGTQTLCLLLYKPQ